MGVTAEVRAIQIVFDIDTSVLTLTGAPALPGAFAPITDGNTVSILSPLAEPVPASASFTFTTASDVTGVEFSIGISRISLDGNALPVPLPAALTFNAGGTPPGDGNGDGNGDTGGGDNGDTGMPTPGYDDLSVALTRVGEGPVNAGDEVVVNVAVAGLESPVTGGEITLTVDPAVAAITDGAPAGGLTPIAMDATSITVIGVPTTLEGGSYGTLTLTLGPAFDGSMVSISASVTVFTAGGMKVSAAAGDPVVVSGGPIPGLETESTEITFEDFGAMASAMVTAVNFAEDATINFTYEATADFQAMEDGSSLTITTGTPGTVTVTATDGTSSASVTIAFSNPDPYLTASETDVIIPEGGDYSVTVTATGLEGVIVYQISKTEGTATR